MPNQLTRRSLLEEIAEPTHGEFDTYQAVINRMSEVLSKHRSELPLGYSCRELIEWGRKERHISVTKDKTIHIRLANG